MRQIPHNLPEHRVFDPGHRIGVEILPGDAWVLDDAVYNRRERNRIVIGADGFE